MYMMFTFWMILFLYFLLRFAKSERGWGYLLPLGMTSVLGFLTQYYFVLFAFFAAAAFVAEQLFRRKWKKAVAFAGIEASSAVCGIALFPASLHQLLEGDKGKETMSLAQQAGRYALLRCWEFLKLVSLDFFGCEWGAAVFGCVLLGLFFYACLAGKELQKICHGREGCLLFCSTAGYFVTVSILATEVTNRAQFPNRYQFPIYPMIVLCAVILLEYICSGRCGRRFMAALAAAFLLLTGWLYSRGTVDFVYEGYQEALETIRGDYADAEAVYVTMGDHLVINDCLFLMQQEETYVVLGELLEELPDVLQNKPCDKLVVYVNIYFDEPAVASDIAAGLGMSSVELLYDNTYTKIYGLEK